MKNKSRNKKGTSTFEREMRNPKFKKEFEKEYKSLTLQELLLAMEEGDEKSVRLLAKEAGLHPNAIQNLKSGKTTDIKLTSFIRIAKAHGFHVELVKEEKHIHVDLKMSA